MTFLTLLPRLAGCALIVLVAACSSAPRPPLAASPAVQPVVPPRFATSFDCEEPQSALQDLTCGNERLAVLDREMAQAYRRAMGALDLVGRGQLLTDQRRWLLRRLAQCRMPSARRAAVPPDAADCLREMLGARIAELGAAYRQPPARQRPGQHPLAAYVEFRLAEDREPALCGALGKRFDEAISAHGQVDPSRMAGFTELAGSHGAASFTREGRKIEVRLYDAGPYASYQMRAKHLTLEGRVLIDEDSLLDWVARMPNSGGSPSRSSSGTADYTAIDIFRRDGRDFVLVSDTWGYHTGVPRGESPHAGLYELVAGDELQPRCLYRTYLTPPFTPKAQIFDRLPAVKNLDGLLRAMAGEVPVGLAPHERLDQALFEGEMQWTLLNMPLLALGEIDRFDRKPAVRRRHDAALEAIFTWSERNLPSKLLYRRLLPAMQPAHAELVRVFRSTQGLMADEAAAAADVALMMMVDRAADSLDAAPSTAVPTVATVAGYTPRHGAVPAPGDLEKNRRFTNLHSALLNRAPPEAVADFIRFESNLPAQERGRGAAGDTALMAALRTPEVLPQLFAAGADPNGHNEWHKTALMTAAQTDQYASARLLLSAGADIQRATRAWQADGAGGPDNEEGAIAGRTALMYAAAGANAPLVRLLLDHGAVVNARDGAGHTACDYLAQSKIMAVAEREGFRSQLCSLK